MATSSVDLLSVLPGLQVSTSDVLRAELFLVQTLQASDATLDLRQGTGVRDLVIRPMATLLATINNGQTYFWTQNSLANVTDSTPNTFVDNILSNWFMSRIQGTNSTIMARLYFSKKTTVNIPTNVYFSVDNVNLFSTNTSLLFQPTQLTYDSPSGTYYVDVSLTAQGVGTSYNVSSGSLVYFSNFNPYFLHAEIQYLSSLGTPQETNTQFITRTQNGISTRNLINAPSISSNLLAAFPGIIGPNVLTVGMGDTYMIRDLVQVIPPGSTTPTYLHIGGCVDIYCQVPTITSAPTQFTTDSSGSITLTGPIYNIVQVTQPTDTILTPVVPAITNTNAYSTTPTSITVSDNTATVSLTGHGLTVGERINVVDTPLTNYSGVYSVSSVIDNNTFTYTLTKLPLPLVADAGSITISYVSRTADVGFSTRQSIKVNFSQPPITHPLATNPPVYSAGPPSTLLVNLVNNGFVTGQNVTISGWSAGNGVYNGLVIPTVSTSTVSGVTWVGGIVTVTMSGSIPFSAGENITITGWPAYTGPVQINTVTSTTFTFISMNPLPSGSPLWTGGTIYRNDYFQINVSTDFTTGLITSSGTYQITNANSTISLALSYFQDIDGIQTYLEDTTNRVAACDQLARGFNLTSLNINITGYGGTAPDPTACATAANTYLNTLSPGAPFIMGDFLAALSVVGVTKIQTPPNISYTAYTRDLLAFGSEGGVITDVYDPQDGTNLFIIGSLNTNGAATP